MRKPERIFDFPRACPLGRRCDQFPPSLPSAFSTSSRIRLHRISRKGGPSIVLWLPPIGTTVIRLPKAFHPLSGDVPSLDRYNVIGTGVGSKCNRRIDIARSRSFRINSRVKADFEGRNLADLPIIFNVLNADIQISAEMILCNRVGGEGVGRLESAVSISPRKPIR